MNCSRNQKDVNMFLLHVQLFRLKRPIRGARRKLHVFISSSTQNPSRIRFFGGHTGMSVCQHSRIGSPSNSISWFPWCAADKNVVQFFVSKQFRTVPGGRYALGNAYTHSATSFRSSQCVASGKLFLKMDYPVVFRGFQSQNNGRGSDRVRVIVLYRKEVRVLKPVSVWLCFPRHRK